MLGLVQELGKILKNRAPTRACVHLARTCASSIFDHPRGRAKYAYTWMQKFHPQPKTRELGLLCANIGPEAQVYARVRAPGAYAPLKLIA